MFNEDFDREALKRAQRAEEKKKAAASASPSAAATSSFIGLGPSVESMRKVLQGIPVGVVGTGSAELSKAEKAAAAEVGQLLARTGAQLVCGLEPGVDHAVLRSYNNAIRGTPDRGHRIHLLATDKELRGYTVRNVPVQKTVVTDGDTFIEELLVRVSVVIMIGGRGFCYRIYHEALRRDIYCIPIPGTGGDTGELGAELAAAKEAQGNATNGQSWLGEELKRRTTDASPTRWVAVVGLRGSINLELQQECIMLGRLLASLRIGLRTGCRTGVDQCVGQSYLDELTRNNQALDSRRYLVWIGPKDIEKPAGRREYGQTEEEHFDLLLEGVSALFVLNGNKWTLRTLAEAALRGIIIIPLALTGGAARSASNRLLKGSTVWDRAAKYDHAGWGVKHLKESEMQAALRQIFEEPRYPEVFAPVVDIPEDASLEEVRELLGLNQEADLA
ncbi:MAG: hypothetical protein QM758_21885 [Armatimonas sp.]